MSSRKTGRIDALADALARRGVLHLREAAALLGVSEMTVRRDVGAHPERFTYLGGHIVSADDVAGGYELDREADSHAGAKLAACRHALRLIAPDDTIFIDCGSTLVHLAQQIPADLPLTAICYSLNVANCLAAKPNVRMILLGGIYHPASATFSSGEWLEPLGRLGINKAFISAGGVDVQRGASCSHFHEVPIKQKAIAGAIESHLVVDVSKFGLVKPAFFAKLSDFRSILTEEGARAAPVDA
ncbi:DeoR family transcriptional regulator [Dongia mobilis]|uniref:DeoR family transcriptional regulator n=1 Tax=Dongia mobilis TaxID=578943 RepID=A0A4R6WV94_9PROT|nr:DeoR family transcriptional regulator [Dongia mobilis]TDQ83216.1 DeoR family transcriptional regulator [Dongia mobilis]